MTGVGIVNNEASRRDRCKAARLSQARGSQGLLSHASRFNINLTPFHNSMCSAL